jgi:hypothetical protein
MRPRAGFHATSCAISRRTVGRHQHQNRLVHLRANARDLDLVEKDLLQQRCFAPGQIVGITLRANP